MNAPDLDALRGRWAASTRTIEAHLRLDSDAMRAALTRQRNAAFRRLRHSFLVSATINLVGCAWIASQLVSNWGDALYFCATLALLPLVVFALVEDFRHIHGVVRLDFAAPVQQVRAQLDALRAGRVRLAKWIALLSVLLWWPFIAVLMHWLIGIDLLRGLHLSVWVGTIAVGLLFVPLGLWIASLVSRRFGARPGFQRFLDEVAGRSWDRASQAYDTHASFEQALAAGDEVALRQRLARRGAAPATLLPLVRALRWRLMAGIALSAVAMLAVGAFNSMHGGQWRFLVPGIVLNLFCVAQLVPGILHSVFLSRLDYGRDAASLRAECEDMAALRRRVARFSLSAAPVMALLLGQVLAKAGWGVDLLAMCGPAAASALATLAAIVSLWLLRRLNRASTLASSLIEALTLGAARATQRLANAVGHETPSLEPKRDSNPSR